jgi:hypothetical protein
MAWKLELAKILSKLQTDVRVIAANDLAGGSVAVTAPSTGQVNVEFPRTQQYAATNDFSVLAGGEGTWQRRWWGAIMYRTAKKPCQWAAGCCTDMGTMGSCALGVGTTEG